MPVAVGRCECTSHPAVIYLDRACGYPRSTRRKRAWPAGNSTIRVTRHASRVTDACTHRHVTSGCDDDVKAAVVKIPSRNRARRFEHSPLPPPREWPIPFSFIRFQIAIHAHFQCIARVGNQLISLIISASSRKCSRILFFTIVTLFSLIISWPILLFR